MADGAIQEGRRTLAATPDDGATHYFIAHAYLVKCEAITPTDAAYKDSSAAWLASAFDHFSRAKQFAREDWGQDAVENQINTLQVHYERGISASEEGNQERMLLEYGLAVTIVLGETWMQEIDNSVAVKETLGRLAEYSVSPSQMAAFHHAWAEILYSRGRADESFFHFRAALEAMHGDGK